ncbi:MAG: molecular chaperone TorD family protein [Pseudomonadales bacterium]|nr:molecular chaperone TorD family protein [Pseudomonadales bacterium]
MADFDQDLHFRSAPERGELYRILVRLLTYPDENVTRAVQTGELDHAIQNLLKSVPHGLTWRCGGLWDDNVKLQSEFMRLFELSVKGTPCVLYGGVYADNRRAVMEELLRYYRHFGLSVDGAPEKDLPDSIPTVLEFMQFLCVMESRAESPEIATVPRKVQKDLLERHLTRWSPLLRERMSHMNPVRVYRDTIEFLDAWCQAELNQLAVNRIH